jgi:hypothetical protein
MHARRPKAQWWIWKYKSDTFQRLDARFGPVNVDWMLRKGLWRRRKLAINILSLQMLYFETRVRTSLLGMRILEFSGMVGYSGFRVRPDLVMVFMQLKGLEVWGRTKLEGFAPGFNGTSHAMITELCLVPLVEWA